MGRKVSQLCWHRGPSVPQLSNLALEAIGVINRQSQPFSEQSSRITTVVVLQHPLCERGYVGRCHDKVVTREWSQVRLSHQDHSDIPLDVD